MANEPKFAQGIVKSIGAAGDDYDVEVVCSDEVIDRSDESIEQAGWKLGNFQSNPVFMAAHMHRLSDGRSPVVGSFSVIGVEGGGKAGGGGPKLVGRVRFADTELGREYKTLYRDGHMRAVSVGFQPLAGEKRSVPGPGGKSQNVYVHTAAELIEVSAVAVGCNQNALSRLRELGFDEETEIEKRLTGFIERAVAAAVAIRDEPLEKFIIEQFDEIKALLPDYLRSPAPDCHPDERAADAGAGQAARGGQAALLAGCQALASAARNPNQKQ